MRIHPVFLFLVIALAGPPVLAIDDLPDEPRKNAPCPYGYHPSGNYCVGNPVKPPNAAILKKGGCPDGYHGSGDYCVGDLDGPPPDVIPKSGPCPLGYHTSGSYCLSNN